VLNVVAAVCGGVLALVLLRRAGRGLTRPARVGWSALIVLVLWLPLYAISNAPSGVPAPRPRPPAVSVDQAALQSPRPSLLFIVIDTVRADCLGCYGSEESRTPNIDRLARQSVLFEQCVTPEPLTRPAICSMLTGLYPRSHGVDTNTKTLSEDFTTIAEVLRRRGYSTGAFVASTIMSADYGTDQGFDVYQEPPEPWSYVGSVFAVRRLHRLLRGDVGVQYLKEYRAEEIVGFLRTRLKPGETVQPLDWTGGVVHGMLAAEAPLPYPDGDYEAWLRGRDTSRRFDELSRLIEDGHATAHLGDGYVIYEREVGE